MARRFNRHIDDVAGFVAQWKRGDMDEQEVVIDTLTNLRHFSIAFGVDFEQALRISSAHVVVERAEAPTGAEIVEQMEEAGVSLGDRREVVSVGLDGASRPMLRYADEMHLPEHARSRVALGDRSRHSVEAGDDPVAHWVERDQSTYGDLHMPGGSVIRAGMTLEAARRAYADFEVVEVAPCGCLSFDDETGEPCGAHHPDAPSVGEARLAVTEHIGRLGRR